MDSWRDAQQAGRVSPFGHRRVTGRLPPRRRFSQAAAPFFASHRLGIHRMRLFAWPYNPNRPNAAGAHAPPSSATGRGAAPLPFFNNAHPDPPFRFSRLDLIFFTLLSIPRPRRAPRASFRRPCGRGANACVSQFVKECATAVVS